MIGAVVAVIVVLIGVAFFTSNADATKSRDDCDKNYVTTKSDDHDSHRVHIDWHHSDKQINVSAKNGYMITKVELKVDNDGHNGFHTYANGPVKDFDPKGGKIRQARVTSQKVCASPTPTPSPKPSPEPSPSPDCEARAFGLYCPDDPSPVDDPNTIGDDPQTTDCDNLDALTEEQALGDCGVSKVQPTVKPVVVKSVAKKVEPTVEKLEAFPQTGFNPLVLLGF